MIVKKFKVGDRVELLKADRFIGPKVGWAGTVIAIRESSYLVEFDNKFSTGHDGEGRGKDRHCWWVCATDIKNVTLEKIIIYRDGDRVYAKDINTGKTAKAICSEDDEFDFGFGARLALERLTEEAPKPEVMLNCKFVVTASTSSLITVGKVYEVKNGKFVGDSGSLYPSYANLHTFEELKNYMSGEASYPSVFAFGRIDVLQIVE